MNIEALRVFCEVARQRSFSRAAAMLQITQSAASQAVQHLEKDLGRKLIDRSHRPPQLTPAGEKFVAGCRESLERLDAAVTETRELGDEVVGSVVVASIYSVGLYQAAVIPRFMEKYASANVRLVFARTNLVLNAVLQGDAALGWISYPKETRDFDVIPWKEEAMVLVCPTDHRLADMQKVRLEDLAGEDFIAFDRDLTIRKRIDAILQQHKVEVRVAMEFDNIETVKQAVQIGAGVSILPEATVHAAVEAGALAAVRFASIDLVRPLGIIHRKGKPLNVTATKLIEVLIESEPTTARVQKRPGDKRKKRLS